MLKDKKYTPWTIFCWAIGIIFIVIASLASSQVTTIKKLDTYVQKSEDIKVDIGSIQTDIRWIRENLKK